MTVAAKLFFFEELLVETIIAVASKGFKTLYQRIKRPSPSQRNLRNLMVWTGTQAEYDALNPDEDTLYLITG